MATDFIVALNKDGKTKRGEATRWLDEVALTYKGDECLRFPFYCSVSGHGRLSGRNGPALAHGYILEKTVGPRPSPAHEGCHSCGHGDIGCVNPKHLYWGTRADNMADRKKHGVLIPPPVMRGTDNVNCKLTEELVRYIRRSSATGISLAAELSVSPASVSAARVRRTWAWVKD